jgi:hypothetical protein
MNIPTDDIHIDPSLDRLDAHQPTFDFLGDLWAKSSDLELIHTMSLL